MALYPLNQMIENLMTNSIDEETGELNLTEEELQAKIAELEIDFDEKIKGLRNSYMTDRLAAATVSGEASALYKLYQETSKRAKALENRADRTKRFIAYLLNGEKYDKDGVKVSYTTRKVAVVDEGFVDWASRFAPEYLNEPTVRKDDLTTALKNNAEIAFAHLDEKKYINIK